MSKFTKALEKIQNARRGGDEAPVEPIPKQDYSEPIEMKDAHWDRGIETVTKTTPDKRVLPYHYPSSMITEQYRSLRTNLKTRMARDNAKTILISSSINNEGKSLSSVNLAISLAEASACRVALIDCDLRRGRIANYLGLDRKRPGMTDFLSSNELSLKDVMVKNLFDNFYVIPRGQIVDNPASLISSEKFRNMLGEIREHFDYVIVDSPPIMSVSDAAIFGREVDGVVMVIQAGRTPKAVLAQAHQLFKQAAVNMYGYILTNVEYQSADYKYYEYNYYGEDRVKVKEEKKRGGFLRKMGINLEHNEEKFSSWMKKKDRESEVDEELKI